MSVHSIKEFETIKHPVNEELAGYEGAKFGMWLFLATELLLFGVLFAAFAIFHAKYPLEFKLAHMTLDRVMGSINTVILITSSMTVALAIDAIQRGKRNRSIWFLVITIVLASGFLVVKYFEYTAKFEHNIFPGNAQQIVINHDTHEYGPIPDKWEGKPIDKNGINLFFSFYFVMTGIHGLHVLIGMIVLTWVLIGMIKGKYTHWYYTPVENGGLYWHLVDLIWIYLFPLFYLIQ
ncbi:MAG: cytochrome c oxidase subunit III [Leptospiraceae bacterium]|nr:MAG: cytochrome c oxidase subunit III [Leptospiraceae bacterium]